MASEADELEVEVELDEDLEARVTRLEKEQPAYVPKDHDEARRSWVFETMGQMGADMDGQILVDNMARVDHWLKTGHKLAKLVTKQSSVVRLITSKEGES